ncbi:MAG: hypothetical protein M1827_003555 [Pycnora praestabilis]|nr:MAG: hypothetical protein M1827_003555 [Pycnora praestabilis]
MPSAINLDSCEERDSTLQNALSDLHDASNLPAKQKKTRVSGPVNTICSHGYGNGLPTDALKSILDIITQPHGLDQTSVTNIIKNLFPCSKVSSNAIICIVSRLGQGKCKASLPTQAALLKWLIMVMDILEDSSILSKLYGILFNLLDMISLRYGSPHNMRLQGPDHDRASLCHLLSLTTRRRHVRPFRIQMLLEITQSSGNEPALVSLVRVFKEYYPNIVVGDAVSGKASYFTESKAQKLDVILPRQKAFKVIRQRRSSAKGNKVAIPEVHTSRSNETSVSLEEIEDVHDLIGKLEKIEPPNQLISAIGDPLLQKFLLLKPSDSTNKRLDSWLSAFFDDELQRIAERQGHNERLSEVLGFCLLHVRYTKTLPRPLELFLVTYINDWDGESHSGLMLELLSYIKIQPFNEVFTAFFSSIEATLLDNGPESKVVLLEYYTSILRQWTIRLLAVPIPESDIPHPPSEILAQLVAHVDLLSLSLLETPGATLDHVSSILSFYETIAFALSHSSLNSNIRINTPSSLVVYNLTFSTSLSTVSRLCGILAVYKRAFETAMAAASARGGEGGYPRDFVNHFNGFLMDICNCLWRNRAFNREDVNALGCLFPTSALPALRTYADNLGHSLPTLFSLSYSTTVCALSIACFRDLEDVAEVADPPSIAVRHAGPVTQRSLTILGKEGGLKLSWANYRLEVLRWLEDRGVKGVGELMFNTMKHLMLAKGGQVGVGGERVVGAVG